MDQEINETGTPSINTNSYLTTVACAAAIIDITTQALSSIDGDGIELIGPKGNSLPTGELHNLVSSFAYRLINDNTISHDVVEGSQDYV